MNNNGITFEWDDVLNVIRNIQGYLVVLAVVLAAAVILTVILKKMGKKKRRFLRCQVWAAALLIMVTTVNLNLCGPHESTFECSHS